ncbi:MAG: hypothetical protein HOE69_00755 [Euryarchaeota archaeon]|jgi:hypothetical protein|nr:hypothetical protein [Euryarchaeota archaeon]
MRQTDESGQMLLATGIILMLSLLTMAWFGVSVASLGDPYDIGSDEVLQVTDVYSEVWQPLIENRSSSLITDGGDWQEAVDAAANSTSADLMRHGEHRGVEIIINEIVVTNNSGVFTVTSEVGIADRHSRLQIIAFEAEIDFN